MAEQKPYLLNGACKPLVPRKLIDDQTRVASVHRACRSNIVGSFVSFWASSLIRYRSFPGVEESTSSDIFGC